MTNRYAASGRRVRFVAFLLLLACSIGHAADGTPVPRHEGWVTDTANVLSVPERKRLSDLLERYHHETRHQLAVLTVPSLSGESIESYSFRIANAWALGYKGFDNGILVALSMKERQVRIQLGKGMERYISDAQALAIIQNTMIPAFKKGNFADGLERGLTDLMKEARRYVVKSPAAR
jgi:uncharacterized protein